MTTLRVTSCADCPFSKDGEMGDWCALDKEQRDLPFNGRPDWCPLSAGPVVVEVEAERPEPSDPSLQGGTPGPLVPGALPRWCGSTVPRTVNERTAPPNTKEKP